MKPFETSSRKLSRVLLLLFFLGAGSVTAPARQSAGERAAVRIDAYLRDIYPAGEPGAAVLVVRDGKILLRAAYGLADIGSRRPLKPDDVFHVASITKNFTAAAVLRLVERGALSLDDPISKHLPDVPAHWREITVRHLLTHTSGLVEFTEEPGMIEPGIYVPHQEIVARARHRPLVSRPGDAWAYNNTGYLLLGLIIERVEGRHWSEYMQDELYTPLYMRDTVFAGRGHARLVPGHEKKDGKIVSVTPVGTIPYAAGATLSTADDLARWIAALERGKILDGRSRRESTRRVRMNDGTSAGYGMGWLLSPLGPYEAEWHGGDIDGYASMLLRIPSRRLLVIVLSNYVHTRERPMFAAMRVAELALGEDWSRGAEVANRTIERLAGVYETSSGDRFVVEVRDASLVVSGGGAPGSQRLRPLSSLEFEGEMRERFRFSPTDTGSTLTIRPFVGKERSARRIPFRQGGGQP